MNTRRAFLTQVGQAGGFGAPDVLDLARSGPFSTCTDVVLLLQILAHWSGVQSFYNSGWSANKEFLGLTS